MLMRLIRNYTTISFMTIIMYPAHMQYTYSINIQLHYDYTDRQYINIQLHYDYTDRQYINIQLHYDYTDRQYILFIL